MSTDSARQDNEIDRDPSQLVPPKIDTRMEIRGMAVSEGLALVPGAAIFALGIMAAIAGYNPLVLFLLGTVAATIGFALIFSASSEYSSARDLAQGGFSFARLQRRLPLSEDETAADPFHGITRIYANGMAETKNGEIVAMIRAQGRNTDLFTDSDANSLVGQLSDGIDHDIRDFDFKYYSTTYEVDPVEVASRYEEQAESDSLSDEKWLPARELLYDVHDWYTNSNASSWGTTKWRHYVVVKVDSSDIDAISRQDKTKSRGKRIFDRLAGQGSQSKDAKRKRMKRKLLDRVETIRANVFGSISGMTGSTMIGPEEHALILSDYYAGATQSFEDIDIDKQTQMSVWPGYYGESEGKYDEPSHRPAAIDNDPDAPAAGNQSGVVGTPTEPTGTDPGSINDSSDELPATPPSGGTANADEAFDDEDSAANASFMARVRDGLLGDVWPNAGKSDGNQDVIKELERQRNQVEQERESVQNAINASEVDRADADKALATIDDEIAEINTEIDELRNDENDEIETKDDPDGPIPDNNTIQDILATEYDTKNGVGVLGQQLTKTFWVADFPTDPDSLFLRNLYTLRGIDLDVTVHANSRDKDGTISELDHQLAKIGAEVQAREEDGSDMSSIAAGEDSTDYEKMWRILRTQNTQPWEVSMYITVRVGERRALDYIQENVENGTIDRNNIDFDYQQRQALKDDCDEVKNIITSSPARLVVTDSSTRQKELFQSCSPNGNDVYDRVSSRDRKRLTMGGTLGAMFPFGTAHIRESSGIEQGRSLQNGTSIIADPFDRNGAPHQLTIAKSGSGKTYSVGKRALRWWLSNTDRTLILCDTMGGFAGLTEICNGQHIVVDGSQTINPLDITKTPERITDVTDIDTFRMKIDELTQFISGILRAQGTDPGDYIPVIEDIAQNTYQKKGITADPQTHDRESPTMSDFVETGVEMIDDSSDDDSSDDDSSDDDSSVFDHEQINAKQSEYVIELLTKLTGFKDNGKYRHLDGQTEARIQAGEVTYLDLQQIEGSDNAEKSTMLHLMLGQVYQAVKRAPAKSMFVIDEAHYLLHSDEMVTWLQRAARHWRHYDASMWFVSQSPQDFAPKSSEEGESRETITGQCSTVEFFRTPELDEEDGKKFGLNKRQITFVQEKATSGSSENGFSQGLMSFSDIPGWIRTQVSASVLEDVVLTYEPSDHGDFAPYLEHNTGIDSALGVGASHSGDKDTDPEVDLNMDGEVGAGPDPDDTPEDQPDTPTAQEDNSGNGELEAETDAEAAIEATANGDGPQPKQQQQQQANPTREQTDAAPNAHSAGADAPTAGATQNGDSDTVEEIGGNGQYDPHMSIHALDTISKERANELEHRNIGEVGDLMDTDPEAIADASGASIKEVSKYMQEVAGKTSNQSTPEKRQSP